MRDERSDVPGAIHDALARMVAKNPDERFASASVALSAFDAAMRAERELVTPEDIADSVARVAAARA